MFRRANMFVGTAWIVVGTLVIIVGICVSL